MAVNAIRQALGDDARQPRFIRTVHGFGYAFCGEVTGREAATRPRWPAVSAACTSNASALVNTQEWSRLVYTEEAFMGRTNIEIDDRLVARAMRLTGARTKREVVDIALRRVVEKGSLYRAVRRLRGRLAWSGDIDAWRSARTTGTNRS